MNFSRRTGIAIAVLMLTALFVYAGGGQTGSSSAGAEAYPSSNFNPTGYPVVKEKVTLTGFANQNVNHRNWDELYCFNEYEKLSNIHIQWTTAPDQGWAERKNLMMASGDYPDIFYRCGFTIAENINYGSRGVLIPLNDLIDKYAVNIKERMNDLPDMAKAMRMPDGNIYSLPGRAQIEHNAAQKKSTPAKEVTAPEL